jgi:hypothetical protein
MKTRYRSGADDGPDMTGIDIPAGDPDGDTLEQLYAAWHREPAGDTLAAIGMAIQELQFIHARADLDEIEIIAKANDELTSVDYVWQGDVDQIIRFARFFIARAENRLNSNNIKQGGL